MGHRVYISIQFSQWKTFAVYCFTSTLRVEYRKLQMRQFIKEKKGRFGSKASFSEISGNEYSIILRVAEP